MFSSHWWSFAGETLSPTGAPFAPSGTLGGPWLRLGPEVYLPQWVTARASQRGLLYQLLQVAAEQAVPFSLNARRVFASRWLGEAEVGIDRLGWRLARAFPRDQELTLSFTCPTADGPASGSIRRARTRFDYETAPEPVWWRSDQGELLLRNLHLRTVQIEAGDGVYSIIGGESRGLVPDTGYYYRRNPAQGWEWLSPESPNASGRSFSLPLSGTYLIAYGSLGVLESLGIGSVTVRWPGGQSVPLPLSPLTPENLFDQYGRLLGLPRLDDENNLVYKRRLLTLTKGPPDTSQAGVIRGIAAELGQLTEHTWDGVSDLLLDPTGALGITAVFVPGVPELREIQEELTPASGGLVCWASYAPWRPGGLVLVEGVPVKNAQVSGSQVLLAQPASGRITAQYSIRQYHRVLAGSGFIGTLAAGTGVPSGAYPVLVSHHVGVTAPALLAVQRDRLLDASGLPTALFVELAQVLGAGNPTVWGRARWGAAAAWFAAGENPADRPITARMPLPFDRVS